MAGGNDNRTEKPTARKLRKAREKGQVARSKEVPSSVVLFGGLFLLYFAGPMLLNMFMVEMRDTFQLRLPAEFNIPYVADIVQTATIRMAIVVGPLMLGALLLSVFANVAQTGGIVFTFEPLILNFGKLSPKNPLGRIFSSTGIVELAKSLMMVTVISFISYQVISQHAPIYPRLVLMDVRQLLYWTATISYQVFLRVSIFLLILALADLSFQKYQHHKRLRMTKQEVKDEFKEMEGDPQVRGRIRRMQREMARKRMMAEVPKADVVITNPTHYAIALSYKMEKMDAPRVVAKGVGFLALRIKEMARKHDVPLVENMPLAQALYKAVEIGESIPTSLYKAVAEILAYIYKARNAWKR